MTAVLEHVSPVDSALAIPLDPSREAHEPPEVWGRGRDNVRLLVSNGDTDVEHTTFGDLPRMLRAGDTLVVNTSATIPAAIDGWTPDGRALRMHFSTEMPGGLWLVEARRAGRRLDGRDVRRPHRRRHHVGRWWARASVRALRRFAGGCGSRRAHLETTVLDHLARFGEPIRYQHAPGKWPLERVPTDLRRRAGERRDAERVSSVHGGDRRRSRAPGRDDRADPVAHGRVVVGGSRDAVSRALPRFRGNGRARQRGARRGRARDRGGHNRRARARDRDRYAWRGASGRRVDRARRDSRAGSARGRRTAHRLARTRGDPLADAGSDRRPPRVGAGVLRSASGRVLVARVRRQSFVAPGALRDERRPRRPDHARRPSHRVVRVASTRASVGRRHRPPARHDGQWRAPTPHRAGRRRVRGSDRSPAAARVSAVVRSSRTPSPRRPMACSPRPTASSPTSCSVTRRRPTPVSSTRLFQRRRDERIRNATARLEKKRTLKAKVAELTRILDDDGYLATFEVLGPGVFRIVEHNCAIWAVAQRYGQACSSEIEFIRAALPGADVERVQHMVAGCAALRLRSAFSCS